jgi:hypothetical protein
VKVHINSFLPSPEQLMKLATFKAGKNIPSKWLMSKEYVYI